MQPGRSLKQVRLTKSPTIPPDDSELAGDELAGLSSAGAQEELLAALVRGMSSGDESALTKLFDATASRVYSVATRIVRNPELADEVVSDVFYQVWRQARTYDPTRSRVITWLLMICHSRAVDALRKRDEAIVHPEPYVLAADPESALRDEARDFLSLLHDSSTIYQSMRKLSPVHQRLIMLAFFYGFSHTEIKLQTGMPLGTIKSHIRHALLKLHDILEAEGETGDSE